ncbi:MULTISPECIES: non-hydrolyzing UDP-N-acetylglucosamine 2-epimerase [Actinoalloteichus]|uniref:UDP-N-acetylglucosamine 2-epimerase n=1 Tax=Actinoalloteichus fjordicus TaxID=1612552 RepID=A0AAC9L799_9PSEU|nr:MULTISPECIES: UDP-N-acetylglucosamine 2-epimerase (non-hydrolyzing) [Actinoalloteichus]APU12508.1 UDP-N-acetylglucosamine 2-epimerase [Actinoalloteichus fjordicus]APU18462.1 UDP-N-acetylglucosamine 2-epimerase [Actinoalloteichus sp. GBA129-24]
MTASDRSVRIAVVVGTRPEAIKLGPVAELLGSEALVVHTGQHFSAGMAGQITPDIVLDAHVDRDISRGHQLGDLVTALDQVLTLHEPDAVLVQGDTTSALAGALAANATSTPLVHLEAGLRSFDRAMPEEHHRVLIDHLADLCCAPNSLARDNLLAERIVPERIEITGNTIVEAVATALPDAQKQAHILSGLRLTPGRFVLATIHRPENADNPVNLAAILRQLVASPMPVVFPQHPRTRRNIRTFGLDHLACQLRRTEPLDYPVLLALIRHAAGLVTDSGGIQEEATILKRPILIIRCSNERPEVEHAFGSRMLPCDERISQTLVTWIRNAPAINARLASLPTPFGDGTASSRAVQAVRSRFGHGNHQHATEVREA